MNYSEQYIYVDASWQVKTKTRTKFEAWQRIQLQDLEEKIIKPSSNHNCFMSVQRYRDAVSSEDSSEDSEDISIDGEDQIHYCGPYFDFDAKPEDGESRADAIARAQKDANRLVDFFLTKFDDINPAHVQVWFSGGKGFHVLVRPEVFGIKPHQKLTYMIRNMAWSVADMLDISTLDRSVYTKRRLWRIENSVHQETMLRKIELDHGEMKKLSSVQIMELAKQPRLDGIYEPEEYENIAPVQEAVRWWDDWERYFEWQQQVASLKPKKRVTRPEGEEGLPLCMKDLDENGPKRGGRKRNHVSMVMATYWKDMGYTREACWDVIDDWTRRHFGHRSPGEVKENLSNGRSAVRSVYRDEKYAFTCSAIRSCGSREDRVACNKGDCKWVRNQADQDPEEIPTLHLSIASQGKFLGKKARIPVHISGKAEAPFGLPLKGRVVCPNDPDNRCKMCPNKNSAENYREWQFTAEDRTVLKLVDVNDNMRKGAIKARLGYPKDCHRCKLHYNEMTNIEAVRMSPMVDYSKAYESDDINQDEITARSSQHAVRDGFYIGHGIQANKKYTITSYAHEHPKDQKVVHVFEEAEPNQNDIENFRLSESMKEKLVVFQPKAGQTVEDKFAEIHRDLCANVHRLNGVSTMATAMDLVFHSVIGFYFLGNFIEKGWFELLVVGDSSTGKSTMMKRLINHYRVGEMIASEGAKRTGLVWASVQLAGKWTLIWGKIPQNDRGLLVMDEFGEMDPEEVTKMTQLRSEGKAVGQGVSSEYEAWARTRLVFLTNVRGNRDLRTYNTGIEAVASIFKAPADFRRTDLAVAIRKGEVPAKIVGKTYKPGEVPHVYTSDLCHNLILWAWSRDPKHIEFADNSEELILEGSQELGERYESNFNLVETNDMRHKLARVSCAVAARMFSTDSRYIKVVVKPEHVDFAARLFDRCYGRGNPRSTMKYHAYAKTWQEQNNTNDSRRRMFMEHIQKYDDPKEIVRSLLQIQDFRKVDLQDQLIMQPEDFKELWNFLRNKHFVNRHRNVFRKSGTFNDFLNMVAHDLTMEDPDNDPPF